MLSRAITVGKNVFNLRKKRAPRRFSLAGKFTEQLEPRLLLSGMNSTSLPVVENWFLHYPATQLPSHLRVAGPVQPPVEPTRWIVQLSDEALTQLTSAANVDQFFLENQLPVTVLRGLGRPGQLLVQADALSSPFAATKLEHSWLIQHLELDQATAAQAIPLDPQFSNQASLNSSSGAVDINAPEAWDLTTGDSQIVIAEIDSGIDYLHPDLTANILTPPGELLGDNIDNDGNGQVDDVIGYDFVDNDKFPLDKNGHGTNVAGIIAAAANNNRGIAGVMWNARLMPIRYLDENNNGSIANAIAAVNYVTMMKQQGVNIRAINASWGYYGDFSQGLYDAVKAAGAADILFVAAAGNGGPFGGIQLDRQRVAFYPASFDLENVISVGAADRNGNLTSFSNYGPTSVDLLAPGEGILTTDPSTLVGSSRIDKYATRNGTSFATPLVTGTAGLVFARNPDASPQEVKEAIVSQVTKIPALGSIVASSGILNASGALNANTFAPTAALSPLTPIADVDQITTLSFSIVFQKKNTSLAANSIDSQSIFMRRIDWQGFSKPVELKSKITDTQGNITAAYAYKVNDPIENGSYEVVLRGDRVRDVNGLAAREKVLARFQVQIVDTNVITVNVFGDSGYVQTIGGIPVNQNGNTSLRSAIQYANLTPGEQTILIKDGEYTITRAGLFKDDDSYRDLDITSPIRIIGSGQEYVDIRSMIDDRIFKITTTGKLTLENLTISGGRTAVSDALGAVGGAIHNRGELTLLRSKLTSNTAGVSGGAIANLGTAQLQQSSLENNLTTGSLNDAGGGAVFNAGTMLIYRSTIAENATEAGVNGTGGGGGGIYNASTGDLTIWTSTLSGNAASQGNGGGLYNVGTAELVHVTIANNNALGSGGGIFNQPGSNVHSVTLATSVIADNSSAGADLSGAEITSDGENFIESSTAPINNNSFFFDEIGSSLAPLDVKLGPLAHNGGLTRTHQPLVGSPVVDDRRDYPSDSKLGLQPVDQLGSVQIGINPSQMGGSQADAGAFERVNTLISGRVFDDLNGNGVLELNEGGRAGIQLYIDLNVNGFYDDSEPTAITSNDDAATPLVVETGKFQFVNRPSNPANPIDTYRIYVVPPNGFQATGPASGFRDVTVRVAEEKFNNNFGLQAVPGALSGMIFIDSNKDGLFESAVDQPQNGVKVFLDQNDNGLLDAGETNVKTDASGTYSFKGLGVPSTYIIRQQVPTDFAQLLPSVTDDRKWSVALKPGDDLLGYDFANINSPGSKGVAAEGKIQGKVTAADGVTPQSRWKVFVDVPNIAPVYTNSDGTFQFTGLAPRTYQVQIERPTDITQLMPQINKFSPTADNFTGIGPNDVALDDVNGDQANDLLILLQGKNELSLVLNNGSGIFPTPIRITANLFSPSSVATGDFNRDGKKDIAVSNFSSSTNSNFSYILNTSTASKYSISTPFLGPSSGGLISNATDLVVADFNRDGYDDVATAQAEAGNTVRVFINNKTAATPATRFANPVSYAAGTYAYAIVAMQLSDDNGDKLINTNDNLDLVVANHDDGKLTILRNNGDATFTVLPATIPVGFFPSSMVVADFDRDGMEDLAVANYETGARAAEAPGSVSILMNRGNFTFNTRRNDPLGKPDDPQGKPISIAKGAVQVAAGDFNGDQFIDIVVSASKDQPLTAGVKNGYSILYNLGDGRFSGVSEGVGNLGGLAAFYVATGKIDPGETTDLVVVDGFSNTYNVRTNQVQAEGGYSVSLVTGQETIANLNFKVQAKYSTAPAGVDLVEASDTGISVAPLTLQDNLTKLNNSTPEKTLQFHVSGTVAGAIVTVYANGIVMGSAIAAGSTTLVTTSGGLPRNLDSSLGLKEGSHIITASQKEAGKEQSGLSSPLTIQVKTLLPNALTLAPVLDPSSVPTSFVFTGTAPVGTLVNLYSDKNGEKKKLGVSMLVQSDGIYKLTATGLTLGNYAMTVTVTDAAGNESLDSPALPVQVLAPSGGFTALTLAPNAAGNLELTDVALRDDNLIIKRSGSNILIIDNTSDANAWITATGISGVSGSGSKQIILPLATIQATGKPLMINTGDGNDVVQLDESNSFAKSPIPATGLTLELGAGGDRLDLINAPTNNLWTFNGAQSGSLALGNLGTASFSGLEHAQGGSGKDVFKLTNAAANEVISLNGDIGSTLDELQVTRNANFVLSDTKLTLQAQTAGHLDQTFTLSNIKVAILTGGNSNNFLDASLFTGSTTLNGSEGHDVLWGGTGNDKLTGGNGHDWLSGNGGDDFLIAWNGRDVLVGGDGRDQLNQSSLLVSDYGDDILIGGRTIYDTNQAAVDSLMQAWIGSGTFVNRITQLKTTGVGSGLYQLNSSSVLNDGATDTFFGGLGSDWFFAHLTGTLGLETPDATGVEIGYVVDL